jgi:hypothetical protein
MGAQVIPLNPRGNKLTGANSDLAGGIEQPQAPPINIRTVAAAGCGFISDALATGGAAFANPLWNLTTLTATFTEGGRADAHEMAKGHATYVPQETDDLFDRKMREREEKNLGWPSCQSIENAGCASCRTCPLKGPSTRPLQFGRPTQAPVQAPPPPTDVELPHNYHRNANGQIEKVVINPKDGTSSMVAVSPFAISKGWMQAEPWTLYFDARLGNAIRTVAITTAEGNSAEAFNRRMGFYGIPLNADQSKLLREFIVAWQTKLQQVKDAVISSSPFGWSEPTGKINGFAYGGRVWQKGGDKPAAAPDPVLGKDYTPKGNLQPWIDAAKMITDCGTPERDAFLAAAFGAPLVRLTGLRGLMVSTYSVDSGAFKSTAMAVAQAVWGNPQTAVQTLDDTQNSVLNKIGTLKALPLFWDELKTDVETTKFVNLTFRLSGGKEKSRMNADTTLKTPGMWQTLLMSASNTSILDHVVRANKTTTAGLFRVFEFELFKIPSARSMNSADQMIAGLNNNFGQAGLVYAKFLGENYDQVAKDVSDIREKLEAKLSIQKDERFWSGTIAVLYMGAVYANRLGLTNIDLKKLLPFLIGVLNNMRREVKSKPVDMGNQLAVSNVMQQYLSEKQQRHLLKTDRIHLNRGKPATNSVKILNSVDKLDGVQIHIGVATKIMRIASTPFRDWAHDKGYPAHTLVNAMRREFNVKETQARLGGGTAFVSMIEYIFEFDLTNPALEALLEY